VSKNRTIPTKQVIPKPDDLGITLKSDLTLNLVEE
jgi:hypothetical protein